MLANSIRSEWLKLRTTRSPWILSAAVLFTSIVAMGGMALWLGEESRFGNQELFTVFNLLGIPLIMILLAMVVTTEYRYKTHISTYLATPNKGVVVASKWIVGFVFAAVLSVVTIVGTLLVAKLFGQQDLSLTNSSTLSNIGTYVVSIAALTGVVHGLGYLLKNTAGVATIMIVWHSGVESLVGILPNIGDKIEKVLFMKHMRALWSLQPIEGSSAGLWLSGGIVCAYALVFLAAGYVVLKKRDL